MNGVFAVAKTSGPTSADVVQKLKHLFSKSPEYLDEIRNQKTPLKQRRKRQQWIKIGHGGTLDPMADGVLVIGVGTGTKQLQNYLGNCTKTYQAIALIGASTTTYDSEGEILEWGPALKKEDLSSEKIETVLSQFRGHISQIPPVFSALKMDGRPLYEYAREGIPLPRAIEPRECDISLLKAGNLNFDQTTYKFPTTTATLDQQKFAESVTSKTIVQGEALISGPTLELTFNVSSGTYIRSLIHDIGVALGTRAHMVKLTRVTQGDWELGKNTLPTSIFDESHDTWWPKLSTVLAEGPKRVID